MVRTTSHNLPGSLEKKKNNVSVFFLRPAASLAADRFTPAAHVLAHLLYPKHLDQHFLQQSSLSQSSSVVNGEVRRVITLAVAVV